MFRVAVVDERGEFSPLLEDPLCTAEIFWGCKKARGIVQAIRFLAPDLLVCDEIADEEEARALVHAAGAGGWCAGVHPCGVLRIFAAGLSGQVCSRLVCSR